MKIKSVFFSITFFTGLFFSSSIYAANIYAGKSKVEAVCSQCHSVTEARTDSPFPPLVERDPKYIEMALKQYRDKSRISEIMNNIASSLTDMDIHNIAAYYNSLKKE